MPAPGGKALPHGGYSKFLLDVAQILIFIELIVLQNHGAGVLRWILLLREVEYGVLIPRKFENTHPVGVRVQVSLRSVAEEFIGIGICPDHFRIAGQNALRGSVDQLGQIAGTATVHIHLVHILVAHSIPATMLRHLSQFSILQIAIHSTPAHFGAEHSQALIGVQMASAYIGNCLMPPLFGLIANHIHVALLPVNLLLILGLMVWMHEKMLRTIS